VEQREGVEVLCYSGEPVELTTPRHAERAAQLTAIARAKGLEMINVQLARGADWQAKSAQIVDFGHINCRRRFEAPVGSAARDGLFRCGRILVRQHASFVQPRPEIAIDSTIFSRHLVNAFGFYVAEVFRQGRFTQLQVENIFRLAMARAFRRTVQ